MTSSGISQNVLKAFERRRTTFVAHQRKSLIQRTNSENIYQTPDIESGNNSHNYPESLGINNKSYSYDNPSFIPEENEEIQLSLSHRKSQN